VTLDDAIAHLRSAIANGRLAHGYVVTGSPREEGRELAESALMGVLCAEGDACGECSGCVRVRAHSHPDVLWIEPQKKSRTMSVEQVRRLQERILQTAFEGGWKACVLVGADRLSESGANAFLKTLEEPPARSIFFLLTDSPQFLLPTILSRCQRIDLAVGDRLLEGEWYDDLMAILAGESAGGGMVAAQARAGRFGGVLKAIRASVEKEVMQAASKEATEEDSETLDARVSSRYRETRTGVLRTTLLWFRDVLVRASGGEEAMLRHTRHMDASDRVARRIGLRRALRCVRVVEDMDRQLARNIAENQVLSHGFAELGMLGF